MINTENRWALVTGAARGIGKLIALKLINYNFNLILVSRDAAHTLDVEKEAVSKSLKALSIGCDLGKKEDVEALIEKLNAYDIDVVYNNAGIQVTYRSEIYDTTWEDYEKSFRVNTIAPMMICYSLLPKMLERGFGRIVNTTSGIAGEPEQGPYSASKAGLDKTTKDLVKLTEGKDVLVFLTDPGWCRTDLGGPNAPNSPESAVNGCVAPGLVSKGVNGMIVHAQDYSQFTLEKTVERLENLA